MTWYTVYCQLYHIIPRILHLLLQPPTVFLSTRLFVIAPFLWISGMHK